MCEANAYFLRDDKEELILNSVDLVQPQDDGGFLLVDIFGTQKIVKGKIKQMNLVDHKIVFEDQK
jgi:predicted RNA-binding protein